MGDSQVIEKLDEMKQTIGRISDYIFTGDHYETRMLQYRVDRLERRIFELEKRVWNLEQKNKMC